MSARDHGRPAEREREARASAQPARRPAAATAPPTTAPIAPPKPITVNSSGPMSSTSWANSTNVERADHHRPVHDAEDDRHRSQQAVPPQPAEALGKLGLRQGLRSRVSWPSARNVPGISEHERGGHEERRRIDEERQRERDRAAAAIRAAAR